MALKHHPYPWYKNLLRSIPASVVTVASSILISGSFGNRSPVREIWALYRTQNIPFHLRQAAQVFFRDFSIKKGGVRALFRQTKTGREVYLALLGMQEVTRCRIRVKTLKGAVDRLVLLVEEKQTASEMAEKSFDGAIEAFKNIHFSKDPNLTRSERFADFKMRLESMRHRANELELAANEAQNSLNETREQWYSCMNAYISALSESQQADQRQFDADQMLRYYTFLISFLGIVPMLLLSYSRREVVDSAITNRLVPFLNEKLSSEDTIRSPNGLSAQIAEQHINRLEEENSTLMDRLNQLTSNVQETKQALCDLDYALQDNTSIYDSTFRQVIKTSLAILGSVLAISLSITLLNQS
eukprot:gene2392-5339_t